MYEIMWHVLHLKLKQWVYPGLKMNWIHVTVRRERGQRGATVGVTVCVCVSNYVFVTLYLKLRQ